MKKQLLVTGLIAALGVSIFTLSGCGHSHKSLNGVYYGYYDDDSDANQFVILAFDKGHSGKVAIRQNLDDIKTNSVFPVTYSAHVITIKTEKGNVKLDISSDNYLLTCPFCDGKSLPKRYSIGMDKGKPFNDKIGGIAFNSIMNDAKAHSGYKP